jgi:hypothetical protein
MFLDANCVTLLNFVGAKSHPPPFRTRTTPAWVNDRDLRRQYRYRDGLRVLRVEQSQSEVTKSFIQHLEYGRTVQAIVHKCK